MNSINWPASSTWVFIAQLGEHCSANAEATGSNPVEAPKKPFFSGYFRNCLNCDSLRWSHTHFSCQQSWPSDVETFVHTYNKSVRTLICSGTKHVSLRLYFHCQVIFSLSDNCLESHEIKAPLYYRGVTLIDLNFTTLSVYL